MRSRQLAPSDAGIAGRLRGAEARIRPSVRAEFKLTPIAPGLSGLDRSPTAAALELCAPSGPDSN